MNNVNFKDLMSLVEAQASPTTVASNVKSVKPPTGGTLKAAAKVAGRGFKNIAKQALFDPEGLGNKMAKSTGYDAIQGAYEGGKSFVKNVRGQRQEDLEKYYLQLAMPNGWPRKGAKFAITTMYNGAYNGVVANVQQISDSDMVYTISGTPTDTTKPPMTFVVTANEKTRPYHSVKQCIVSNVTPDNKYVKNDKESGHAPKLSFNPETGIYELDYKERPSRDTIFGRQGPWLKVRDAITGFGQNSQEIISGIITAVSSSEGPKAPAGTGRPIYQVDVNP